MTRHMITRAPAISEKRVASPIINNNPRINSYPGLHGGKAG